MRLKKIDAMRQAEIKLTALNYAHGYISYRRTYVEAGLDLRVVTSNFLSFLVGQEGVDSRSTIKEPDDLSWRQSVLSTAIAYVNGRAETRTTNDGSDAVEVAAMLLKELGLTRDPLAQIGSEEVKAIEEKTEETQEVSADE